MNLKIITISVFSILQFGCAAKNASEELQASNYCYQTTVKQTINKYSGNLTTSDLRDLNIALEKHYDKVSHAELLKQRSTDISDPIGGIPASFNVDSAVKDAKNSVKPIFVILNRNSVAQGVSTAIQRGMIDSLTICYGNNL